MEVLKELNCLLKKQFTGSVRQLEWLARFVHLAEAVDGLAKADLAIIDHIKKFSRFNRKDFIFEFYIFIYRN